MKSEFQIEQKENVRLSELVNNFGVALHLVCFFDGSTNFRKQTFYPKNKTDSYVRIHRTVLFNTVP